MTSTETNQELDGLAAMAHAQYAAVLRDTAFGPTLPYADLPHVHREAWQAAAGAVARAVTVPPPPTVGRCMRLSPDTFGTGHRVACVLPFGHLGAHTDGEAHWTRMTDGDEPE